MKRIGSLKGIPIVEGNSNELKKNNILYNKKDGKIELSKRENGQVSNISGGNSGVDDKGNYIYCAVKDRNKCDSYALISTITCSYYILNNKFSKMYITTLGTTFPNGSELILMYLKLELPLIDNYNSINITTLEEFEQLNGLDSNNRPFKIITEEEFYKDLTEEEARKIASEL